MGTQRTRRKRPKLEILETDRWRFDMVLWLSVMYITEVQELREREREREREALEPCDDCEKL